MAEFVSRGLSYYRKVAIFDIMHGEERTIGTRGGGYDSLLKHSTIFEQMVEGRSGNENESFNRGDKRRFKAQNMREMTENMTDDKTGKRRKRGNIDCTP